MANIDYVAHGVHMFATHRQWCRRNGVAFPAVFDSILTLLVLSSDQERSFLDLAPSVADDPVQALNYQGAAKRLGVSVCTARRMVRDGRLAAVRIGRRVVIPCSAVDDYLRAKNDHQQVAA